MISVSALILSLMYLLVVNEVMSLISLYPIELEDLLAQNGKWKSQDV